MTPTTKSNFKRTLRVCYPTETGTLVIRTALHWGRDIYPIAMSNDGTMATFEIEARQPFVHSKPCLIKNEEDLRAVYRSRHEPPRADWLYAALPVKKRRLFGALPKLFRHGAKSSLSGGDADGESFRFGCKVQ